MALSEQVLQALEQMENNHRQTGGSADDVIETPSMLAALMMWWAFLKSRKVASRLEMNHAVHERTHVWILKT